jgi:hypothetical protein
MITRRYRVDRVGEGTSVIQLEHARNALVDHQPGTPTCRRQKEE